MRKNNNLIYYFYAVACVEALTKTVGNRIIKIPRKLLFFIHPGLTVRILGGYSLMVLAK